MDVIEKLGRGNYCNARGGNAKTEQMDDFTVTQGVIIQNVASIDILILKCGV